MYEVKLDIAWESRFRAPGANPKLDQGDIDNMFPALRGQGKILRPISPREVVIGFEQLDSARKFAAAGVIPYYKGRVTVMAMFEEPAPAPAPSSSVSPQMSHVQTSDSKKARADNATPAARPQRPQRRRQTRKGQDQRQTAPYHFVPVLRGSGVADTPVLHDRMNLGDRFTGELLLSFTNLTPYLPGNYQYEFSQISGTSSTSVSVSGPPFRQLLSMVRRILDSAGLKESVTIQEGTQYQMTTKASISKDVQDNLSRALASVARWSGPQGLIAQLAAESRLPPFSGLGAIYQRLIASRGVTVDVDPKKAIIEPMSLPPDANHGTQPGPIAVAGNSLKAMLRNSIAALLSAPMERVEERTFSFRPNTHFSGDVRKTYVAYVVAGGGRDAQGNPLAVDCDIIPLLPVDQIAYVHPDAFARIAPALQQRFNPPTGSPPSSPLTTAEAQSLVASGLCMTMAKIVKVGSGPGSCDQLDGWTPARHFNGVDLEAQLNQIFHRENAGKVKSTKSAGGYGYILLDLRQNARRIRLDADQLRPFYESLEHLQDKKSGHLRDHPLLRRHKINPNALGNLLKRGLKAGDVFFIEQYNPPQGEQAERIGPLGGHVYFRQRYRDTIHLTKDPELAGPIGPQSQVGPALRDILCPRPFEQQTGEGDARNQSHAHFGRPAKLTAARRLLGYASPAAQYRPQDPLSFGIGWVDDENGRRATDFTQIAGRLSFNLAVENLESAEPTRQRFINQNHGALVPLRPLGSPKPSAVEHYLIQDVERVGQRNDGGILSTYGDTELDPSAGDLAGRKFYLHQPAAAADSSCYELLRDPPPTRNQDANQAEWRKAYREMFTSNQAAIGRFMLAPGAKFRVTLRLSELDDWELGAVFLCLAPTVEDIRHFAAALGVSVASRVTSWLDHRRATETSNQPFFAVKHGHGRPLGLGSLQFSIDGCRRLELTETNPTSSGLAISRLNDEELREFRKKKIIALAEFLKSQMSSEQMNQWVETVLVPWLEVHRYAGRTKYDYPRDLSRKPNDIVDQSVEAIFNHHTNLRRKHALGRKQAPPANNFRDQFGIKKLDEFE